MLQILTFIFGSLALLVVSRKSILKPGTHGFYRFFAWELMLLLYVINMRVWDLNMDAPHQLFAGAFFITSLFLLIVGGFQLLLMGKPDDNRDDVPMLHFEKTTVLVTSGIYHYIRHPIYGSLFFLCWGFFFKSPAIIGGVIALAASALLVATARVEELENISFFGDEYRDYMKRSKMLVPFIL